MINPASFRDPSGFVFEKEHTVYRQVNQVYAPAYRQLMQSGLYDSLVQSGELLPHAEIDENLLNDPNWFKCLQPEQLSFISYPYEWSFDQLRDAGLLTLSILLKSVEKGMILKDATAYNIQFRKGQPVFIDTLSFQKYDESKPWIAYRQFCEHFLFPLYLEHYLKTDFNPLLSHFVNGIPVSFTAQCLPWRSKWNLGVRLHVLLQNKVGKQRNEQPGRSLQFSKQKLLNVARHLQSILRSLKPGYPSVSTWSNYYDETILGQTYLQEKKQLVKEWLEAGRYDCLLDLGANEGVFSELASAYSKQVIATDFDSRCINDFYNRQKKTSSSSILPLIIDLSNPSANIGFANTERKAFFDRVQPDLVMALALIHHLAIANNVPLSRLAEFFNGFAPSLIIEFVPRQDPKVKELLKYREDIFQDYTSEQFEIQFGRSYQIERKTTVPGTERIMYYLKRK